MSRKFSADSHGVSGARQTSDAFDEDGDLDILRTYRHTSGATMIIRCTESGAPDVLDKELDALVAANPAVRVLRLPLTHLAPAWDLDDYAEDIERFLAMSPA